MVNVFKLASEYFPLGHCSQNFDFVWLPPEHVVPPKNEPALQEVSQFLQLVWPRTFWYSPVPHGLHAARPVFKS
jgi:hypothetical protein